MLTLKGSYSKAQGQRSATLGDWPQQLPPNPVGVLQPVPPRLHVNPTRTAHRMKRCISSGAAETHPETLRDDDAASGRRCIGEQVPRAPG